MHRTLRRHKQLTFKSDYSEGTAQLLKCADDSQVTEGGHASEDQVNKQLNDKERVAAALENHHLFKMVEQCLSTVEMESG
jgi:hypothetical protein